MCAHIYRHTVLFRDVHPSVFIPIIHRGMHIKGGLYI